MPQVFRWFVGNFKGRVNCTFRSKVFRNESVVLISASEGHEPGRTDDPRRFVGDAYITVHNIAPSGFGDPKGGDNPLEARVEFVLTVDYDKPLPIWADIVVLDEFPKGFSRSDP